jgi:hypothetical protein
MFWVEFGVESRPKRESFGVDFTSRETYSQTGRHVWMPCFGTKNPSASAVGQVAHEPLEPPSGSQTMRKRVAPPPKYDMNASLSM